MQSWGSAVVWIDILRGQVLWLGEPPHGLSLDLLKVMVVYPSGTLLQSYMVVALAGSKCLLWLKVASPHHSWEPSMATTSWKSPPLTLTLAAEPRGGGGCALRALTARDLGLLEINSNSVAKSSGKFLRAELEVWHLVSIGFQLQFMS